MGEASNALPMRVEKNDTATGLAETPIAAEKVSTFREGSTVSEA
jgi:hypothetical protein